MNLFSRTKNLYNIQKSYKLFREALESKDKKRWNIFIRSLLKIQEFREMLDWLKGKKTYIVAALTIIVQGLYMSGYIDEATRDNLLVLLGVGAISTVSAKINRVDKKIE